MRDPCHLGPALGRIADCHIPVVIEPMDYLTMDTPAHFQLVLVAVLTGIIWTGRRRWRRVRLGGSARAEGYPRHSGCKSLTRAPTATPLDELVR
jgi:hypothetical protein